MTSSASWGWPMGSRMRTNIPGDSSRMPCASAGFGKTPRIEMLAVLGGLDPGRGLVHRRQVLVQLLRADCAGRVGGNGPVALVGLPRQLQGGLVEGDLALGLVELGLVGSGVDPEQQVSFLDLRPL